MIKFINNIDNLLNEIIKNKELVIIFYNLHCNNSEKIISIINDYDFDIDLEVILIDKYEFLQKNYNKLETNYLNYYIQNNTTDLYYNNNFNNIIKNLSFLNYNNLIDLITPHVYFMKKNNNIPVIVHKTVYYANLDHSNNFVKLLNNFGKTKIPKIFKISENKISIKNKFISELWDIDVTLEEINKIKIFI